MSTARTRTILIAEEEDPIRLLVRLTLESDDYQIVEAADGEAAWEQIKTTRPRLVVLDEAMHGRSGLDITRALRADRELEETHVVLLTEEPRVPDAEESRAASADDYLAKPFSPLQLLGIVDRALRSPQA